MIGIFWTVVSIVVGVLCGAFICNAHDAEYKDQPMSGGLRAKVIVVMAVISLVVYLIRLWPAAIIGLYGGAIWQVYGLCTQKVTESNVKTYAMVTLWGHYMTALWTFAGLATVGPWADWIAGRFGNKALGAPTLVVITALGVACSFFAGSYRFYTLKKDQEKKKSLIVGFVICVVLLVVLMFYFIVSAKMS